MATQQEILDVLRRARERIADPARWCQNRLARDGHGELVPVRSPRAVAWCAMGAIYAEVAKGALAALGEQADALLETTAYAMFNRSEAGVNDVEGHAAVLALYDRAIADAEAAVRA